MSSVYRSKEKINTDKQFVFTADLKMSKDFWIAFIIHDKEISDPSLIDSIDKIASSEELKAVILIDNSNKLLLNYDSDYGDKNKTYKRVRGEKNTVVQLNKPLEDDKEFNFFDNQCIWLYNKVYTVDDNFEPHNKKGKFYEKITNFEQKDLFTEENGSADLYTKDKNVYKAANKNKYSINEKADGYYAMIDTKDYPVISTFSFNKGEINTKEYITKFPKEYIDESQTKRIKFTLTKNAMSAIYLQIEEKYNKLGSSCFKYKDNNDNYLYIVCSDQNILSNAAVSGVESSDTSANIA